MSIGWVARRAVTLTTLTVGLLCATAPLAWSGGGNKVTPVLDCAWNNNNGTYDVTFGYVNVNGSPVVVPLGDSNYVSNGSSEGTGNWQGSNGDGTRSYPGQPTTFAVGTLQNVWVLRGVPVGTSWVVEGHSATLTGDSPPCGSKQVSVLAGWIPAGLGLLAIASAGWVASRRSSRVRVLLHRFRQSLIVPRWQNPQESR